MKYSVGDRVRIISKWGIGCHQNEDGEMDKWLGKVMTIREVDEEEEYYRMEEDVEELYGNGWHWYEPSIAELVEKKEPKEFEKNNFRVGDRVRRIIMECEDFCKVGDTGTILVIDNSNCPVFVQWDNGKTSWNCKSYLEHATEENQQDSGNDHMSKEDIINKVVAALRSMQFQLVETMNLLETYCGILFSKEKKEREE